MPVSSAAGRLVHELFEEQVRRTPGAVAVIYEGMSLSYAELNARANQLANYLRERRVGPEQRVAICVERGLEMVVGLIGVLKAGGAYVPLDPGYPWERLQYMLMDAAPRILLTQAHLQDRLPQTQAELVMLDEQWAEISRQPVADIALSGLTANHLAYVIYTSGSTGQPKGVMIEHEGLANYLQWALHTYRPEEGDAAPVSTPLAFDATITSLYCPLLSGRCVVLIPTGQELEGLERLLQQSRQWSLVKISPAHLQVLGQRLLPLRPPCTVKAFVIGGEALSTATVRLWRSIWPQTRLINEYGPTETVVGCCVYEIPADWTAADNVPIGTPIANTRMYILDNELQRVPLGATGEIYIAGAGVARGYLNRPELTEQRFVQDPFSSEPRARMYKTGDLGRWRPDGNIEYLGRNDTQVKIRGFRIELGEIEVRLLQHPQVKEAVVLAREDQSGDKRLVAYVVGESATTSTAVLRAHLAERLPDHMIPPAWMVLEKMPLTSNGKIDRRALPEPQSRPLQAGEYVAPTTDLERAMVRIWEQTLRVDPVGVKDSLLDLGGNSLHAMKITAGIAEDFKVDLSVAELLQAATVAELIMVIQSRYQEHTESAEYEDGVI